MIKNIDYYMNLNYQITVTNTKETDGSCGVLLEMPELGRLSTCAWGETYEEAYALLREIQRDNIEDLLSSGLDVPEPRDDGQYSGRLNLRMAKSLHRKLSEISEKDGISINTLINNLIHDALGAMNGAHLVANACIEHVKNIEIQHSIKPSYFEDEIKAAKSKASASTKETFGVDDFAKVG